MDEGQRMAETNLKAIRYPPIRKDN